MLSLRSLIYLWYTLVLTTLPFTPLFIQIPANLLSIQLYYVLAYQKSLPIILFFFYPLCNLTNLLLILFLCSCSFSWYVHQILEFFTVFIFIRVIINIIILFLFLFLSLILFFIFLFFYFFSFIFSLYFSSFSSFSLRLLIFFK